MIRSFVAALIFSFPVLLFGQKVLMEENVSSDSIRPTRGPNLKNYTHMFLSFGMPVYESLKGAEVNVPGSLDFTVGLRKKYKLCEHNAVGVDLNFDFAKYKMKQTDGKILPDTVKNDRELFRFSSVNVSIYDRINIGRRGNVLGKYLDLAAWGGYHLMKRHEIRNKNADGEIVEVFTSRLQYANGLIYGVEGRLGWNWIALKANYRLSDYFTSESGYPELPRLWIGLEFILPGK